MMTRCVGGRDAARTKFGFFWRLIIVVVVATTLYHHHHHHSFLLTAHGWSHHPVSSRSSHLPRFGVVGLRTATPPPEAISSAGPGVFGNRRRRPGGGLATVGLRASPDPTPISTSSSSPPDRPSPPRRTRTNKYQQFSQVDPQADDPWDQLLAQAAVQNQALQQQQVVAAASPSLTQSVRRGAAPRTEPLEIPPLPVMQFPDTRHIDPYDPTTFGYIEIGHIVGAHGVQGWVRVRSTTDMAPERLCTAGIRHIKPALKRAPRPVILLEGRSRRRGRATPDQGTETSEEEEPRRPARDDKDYLVRFQGIDQREMAQQLRGSTLYLRQEQKEPPKQEEYYVADLVGLNVYLIPTPQGLPGASAPVNSAEEGDDRQYVGQVGGVVFAEDISDVPGLGHDYVELILPRGVGGTFSSWQDELVLIPLVPQIVPHIDIPAGALYLDPPGGLLDLTYVREEKTRIKGFLPPAPPSDLEKN